MKYYNIPLFTTRKRVGLSEVIVLPIRSGDTPEQTLTFVVI
jgi:hypothetical protein